MNLLEQISMLKFTPTWLYIKQHNETGLKYFGKTISKDPVRYKGSGTYWKSHLREHGSNVSTVWCQLFHTEIELLEYAQTFSTNNNIVESIEWANLIAEDGKAGGAPKGSGKGRKMSNDIKAKISQSKQFISQETRDKMSSSLLGRIVTNETKQKISNSLKGRDNTWYTNASDATKEKISIANLGKKRSNETKQKMADAARGKPKTEAHRRAIAEALRRKHVENNKSNK